MPTTTTTYTFNKPTVGGDEDAWGGYLNGNWDSIDDLLDGTTPVTGIDINSGSIDGTAIGASSASTGAFTTLSASSTFTLGGTAVTSTAAELNLLDGSAAGTIANSKGVVYGSAGEVNATTLQIGGTSITATAAEINYLDITTLGTSEASKAVTADANGVVTFDNGISEESTAVTSSAGAATLNMRDGTNFTHTLSENVTYTFSNPASSGYVSSFTLKVTQDSTARTITWPSSVDWAAATAPTLTTTSGGVDVFVFITYDGGTNWYGFTAGQAMA